MKPGRWVALLAMTTIANRAPAQDLPAPDARSAHLAIASRGLWRSMSLAKAASVTAAVAVPLWGAPGLARGLQIEARSWNALVDRGSEGYADQYALTARYLHPLGGGRPAQYISVAYTEYLNPKVRSLNGANVDRSNREIALGAAVEIGIPSQGVPSIRFVTDMVHDLHRSRATYARFAASHAVGRGPLKATATVAVSGSDYHSSLFSSQPKRPDFGFHSVDGRLALAYAWPVSRLASYATTTSVAVDGTRRAERLGPTLGWVSIMQTLQIF